MKTYSENHGRVRRRRFDRVVNSEADPGRSTAVGAEAGAIQPFDYAGSEGM